MLLNRSRLTPAKSGNVIVAVIVGGLAFIAFVLALILYIIFPQGLLAKSIFGTYLGSANAQSANLATTDCSGAKIPTGYLPWIKQAAAEYLDGDEAKLIAVIQFESHFRPDAISDTGAVGLGQFVVPGDKSGGAAGLSRDFFQNLPIIRVPRADKSSQNKVTPDEKKAFLQTSPQSGRLQPGPAIMATAHKLKIALKTNNGDFRLAYALGYNGEPGDAKYQHADTVVGIYNQIKADGVCKELKDTPGKLGADLKAATAASAPKSP